MVQLDPFWMKFVDQDHGLTFKVTGGKRVASGWSDLECTCSVL